LTIFIFKLRYDNFFNVQFKSETYVEVRGAHLAQYAF